MNRIKVGLHNHSSESDGYFTVGGLLRYLQDNEYDVVAITDHNRVTVPHPIHLRECGVTEDLLILRGIEVSFPLIHIICIEPILHKHIRSIMDYVDAARVAYIAHPKFSGINPVDCQRICDKFGLDGVEAYNSGFLNFKGDLRGHLYAGDDLHIPSQVSTSWIEMNVGSVEKEGVLERLKSGDFEVFNQPHEVYPRLF